MHLDIAQISARISQLFSFLPHWFAGLLLLLASGAIAIALHRTVIRLLTPRTAEDSFARRILERTRRLIRIALVVAALGVILPATGFPLDVLAALARALFVAMILILGWSTLVAADVLTDLYLSRWNIEAGDNLLARKHVTQVRVLRRSFDILVVIVTIAIALMTFPAVREYGLSLFASAGAAGLIVGLAARPLLTNLIAGVQIAVTQPIRVEDAVIVNGEWGWIEEIASTYVVVRIWDWRRMIVPLSHFIEHPFQNWTRQSAQLIGSVHWHLDYTVPVEVLRRKLGEIVRSTPLWDGKVVALQVTGALATTIELRALVSAQDSGKAWDLRCYVREKMIDFLQNEYPYALPRQRVEMNGELARGPAEQAAFADARGAPGDHAPGRQPP